MRMDELWGPGWIQGVGMSPRRMEIPLMSWEDSRSGCDKENQDLKWTCHIGRWASEAGVD